MRYLVEVEVSDLVEIVADSPEEAIAAAKDIFNITTADTVSTRIAKTFKDEEKS